MLRKLSILALLFMVSSCLPQSSQRRDSRSNAKDNSPPPSSTNEATNTTELYFFHRGQRNSSLRVPSNTSNIFYIRGGAVDQFFKKTPNVLSSNYCFIGNFSNIIVNPSQGTSESRQLRIRAIPTREFDYSTGKYINSFKLELNNSSSSTNACPGVFAGFNSSQTPQKVFFSSGSLCPNCNTDIRTQNLHILKVEGNQVSDHSNTQLTNGVPLSLQFTHEGSQGGGNNSGEGSHSCTQNSCTEAGTCCNFDIGRCVTHASPKPGVQQQYPELLQQAQNQIATNPRSILNYPHLFYICADQVPQDDTGGNTTGGEVTVERVRKDYKCAEEMRKYAIGSPYQLFLNTTPTKCGTGGQPSCECKYSSTQTEEDLYYQKVLERLYDYCRCPGNSLNEKLQNCPEYYYKVLAKDSQDNPTQFRCDPVAPIAFNPNVTLNSRSIPHRFYSELGGGSVDNLKTAPAGTKQEGVAFRYNDPSHLLYPVNGSYNMNSILGNIKLDLSEAHPAKIVNVEQGRTYMIKNDPGSIYLPCPNCGSDSWFQSFSAWPSTIRDGLGLQAYGHSTKRNENQHNAYLGNYEDTHWGRACFLPPTMIPFSQKPNGLLNAQTSRRSRLKTQAALFANGYQRDWFGFNRGAIIGSFDGVSWFAVGSRRIVTASSKKLFLAINAPFGDLATPTVTTLKVEPYAQGSGSTYDYNPNLKPSRGNPNQNMGGSCQRYHICKTDKDCITQLGWEYTCAEMSTLKTYWPSFSGANEVVNNNPSPKGILGILQQDEFPSTETTRRCFYRGAGSPCVLNPKDILDVKLQKSLTCAPNFYCAAPSLPVFNKEVSRFGGKLLDINFLSPNHLYGQDANVLGRPRHYAAGVGLTGLPLDIQNIIKENIFSHNTGSTPKIKENAQIGLCRPGKSTIPDNASVNTSSELTFLQSLYNFPSLDPVKNHGLYPGGALSTDYISQVGVSNVNNYSSARYLTCPVLDEDGNYLHLKEKMLNKYETSPEELMKTMLNYMEKSQEQNITSRENLDPNEKSPFSTLEGGFLSSSPNIIRPSLVRNACMRRAGSPCHSDLDCAPNSLHSPLVSMANMNFFGNPAEKAYWEETLVCGQADKSPAPNLSTFETHDIKKNKCCREVEKDISIYTPKSPQISFELDSQALPFISPQRTDRYSRFLSTDTKITGDHLVNADGKIPLLEVLRGVAQNSQWKVIHETAKRTCCGGGWIRKFASGHHDWASPNAPNFLAQNFQCLNYSSTLATFSSNELKSLFGIPENIVNRERNLLCDEVSSPVRCSQINFPLLTDTYENTPPSELTSTSTDQWLHACTADTVGGACDIPSASMLHLIPYTPRLFSGDLERAVFYKDGNDVIKNSLSLKMPMYIPWENLPTVSGGGKNFEISVVKIQATGSPAPISCGTGDSSSIPASENTDDCSFTFNKNSGNLIVKLTSGGAPYQDIDQNGEARYLIRISFLHKYFSGEASKPGAPLSPGSPYFYLKRLAQMELAGVPQIHHQPIYCNDNSRKLVPGLYKSSLYGNESYSHDDKFSHGQDHVQKAPSRYRDGGTPPSDQPIKLKPAIDEGSSSDKYEITNYKDLATAPVFSEHEFSCCKKLGSYVQRSSECCSGFTVFDEQNNAQLCKLPPRTNVSLYFNRYISGEGIGKELANNDLELNTGDFNPHTGEPLLTTTVTKKLERLARAYCSTGEWRKGAAFGNFIGQPNSSAKNENRTYSIVDDYYDQEILKNQDISSKGKATMGFRAFSRGYRWNHHIYCYDPNDNL